MNFVIWILFAAIISVFPVFFVKKYNKTHKYIWIILCVFFYFILTIAYSKLFFNKNMIVIYPIIKIISILLVTIIGYLLFDYKLSLKSYIGVFFAMLSIYLLSDSI